MAEIEENEFNLNLPRYVDTFEPEEEIDLAQATQDLTKALADEQKIFEVLSALLRIGAQS
jgi:type I restriction enzyme M protein